MDLLGWFEVLTVEKVEAMVGDPESQVLDCKRIGGEADMKGNLAKVISGFANGQGGICLWGVDARKGKNGIDCIHEFPGLDDPVRTAARLDELSPQATSPGVPGVIHKPLVSAAGRGYVATFVPASDGGPHMARFGEDRYFQRIGQQTMRMEHFQIADMFGRRARPILQVSAQCTDPANQTYRVRITNIGRGPARAPFVRLEVARPFSRNPHASAQMTQTSKEGDRCWVYSEGADFVIHPTTGVAVAEFLIDGPSRLQPQGEPPPRFALRYKVGALDLAPVEGEVQAH